MSRAVKTTYRGSGEKGLVQLRSRVEWRRRKKGDQSGWRRRKKGRDRSKAKWSAIIQGASRNHVCSGTSGSGEPG